MRISITGSTGFVGQNLVSKLLIHFDILEVSRSSFKLEITDGIIHLAGKAHDLKNVSSPDEYYKVNTDLTKKVFDDFLESNAKVFITLSSVKAAADQIEGELSEDVIPNPITH